jgi:hypothetical protein
VGDRLSLRFVVVRYGDARRPRESVDVDSVR